MGGPGSGRDPYAYTATVGECRTLDVNKLKGYTRQPGTRFRWVWWPVDGSKDDPSASITIHVEGDPWERAEAFRLKFTVTDHWTGEERDHDYRVPLEYTPCHLGGDRPWFRCPGVVNDKPCRRRCAKLHLPPGEDLFLCRECYNLGYQSSRTSHDPVKQAELRYRREFARADADNRRPHPNDWETWTPRRPKGMHHDTFEDLCEDVEAARQEWDRAWHHELRTIATHAEDLIEKMG